MNIERCTIGVADAQLAEVVLAHLSTLGVADAQLAEVVLAQHLFQLSQLTLLL